ncbi:hypothetical protein RAF62_27355, partial [Klebsiella pneumoniae]
FVAIMIPFTVYFDKNAPYLNVPTFSTTFDSKTDREGKLATDFEKNDSKGSSFIFNHLLLSIFVNNSYFSRTKKIMVLSSNIIFGIFVQTALLQYTSLHPGVAGLVSALATIVPSAINIALFSFDGKIKNLVAITVVITMFIVGIVGVFTMKTHEHWYIALLAGLASEIFISQTAIMMVKKIIS